VRERESEREAVCAFVFVRESERGSVCMRCEYAETARFS